MSKRLNPLLKGKVPSYYICDLETTMDHQTIRLFGIRRVAKKIPSVSLCDPEPEVFKKLLAKIRKQVETENETPVLVTWNGARFDIPLLRKHGIDLSGWHLLDAMQMAQMYDHTFKRKGLAAWAKYFGVEDKSDLPDGFDYDTCPIPELVDYLNNDLEVTEQVFKKLMDNQLGTLDNNCFKALRIEHRVAELCQEQVERRVRFDMDLAQETVERIVARMNTLESKLARVLPVRPLPESKIDRPPKTQFKKDGTPSVALQRWAARNGCALVLDEATRTYELATRDFEIRKLPLTEPLYTTARIKPSNMAEIKAWLLERGWVPTEWNMKEGKRTTPRLTLKGNGDACPALAHLGVDWMDDYKEWLMLRSRKNVLHSDKGTGWIPKAAETNPPSLPSDADTMGANTSRWTHKIIANVPRPKTPWGEEMRACHKARPGFKMVGWDASALEARVEAHYCFPFDPYYAHELVDGDVHTRNLEALPSLGSRDNAKTFKYAITYGAQAPRLASYFGWDIETAERIFNSFWETNTALKEVRDRTIAEWESNNKRFIRGLDGRPIHTRSKHSLLNALFQSAGAVIMKYSMLIANQDIKTESKRKHFQAFGLIRYHDEEEWEVEDVIDAPERVGKLGVESIRKAGRVLNLRAPLEAEYKVGNNWSEVH